MAIVDSNSPSNRLTSNLHASHLFRLDSDIYPGIYHGFRYQCNWIGYLFDWFHIRVMGTPYAGSILGNQQGQSS